MLASAGLWRLWPHDRALARRMTEMLAGALPGRHLRVVAAKLRRVIIAARFKASRPDQPTCEEISVLRLAWEDAAA